MKYKDFEDYMMWKFAEENPTVLDDDYPDCSSEWLQGLSVDEWLEYGEKYSQNKETK